MCIKTKQTNKTHTSFLDYLILYYNNFINIIHELDLYNTKLQCQGFNIYIY